MIVQTHNFGARDAAHGHALLNSFALEVPYIATRGQQQNWFSDDQKHRKIEPMKSWYLVNNYRNLTSEMTD